MQQTGTGTGHWINISPKNSIKICQKYMKLVEYWHGTIKYYRYVGYISCGGHGDTQWGGGNGSRRPAAVEHVVGVPRTPSKDTTRTTLRRGLHPRRGVASQLELSFDDGGVGERRRRTGAIGDCGRSRRDKLQGGRGKCNAGLADREGFYSRAVSMGICGISPSRA